MARQVNHFSREKIKTWEGVKLKAYRDTNGTWTIGYGHTGPDVYEGLVITMERADELLTLDLRSAEVTVDGLVKVPLTDNQFGALVSFVFNVGNGAFQNSTLLRKLNAGDYEAVPKEMMRWDKETIKGKKVSNRGLANRRAAETGLWASGSFVASNTAVPSPVKDTTTAAEPEVQGTAVVTAGASGALLLPDAADKVNSAAKEVSVFAEYSDELRILFGILIAVGIVLTLYGFFKKRRA